MNPSNMLCFPTLVTESVESTPKVCQPEVGSIMDGTNPPHKRALCREQVPRSPKFLTHRATYLVEGLRQTNALPMIESKACIKKESIKRKF
jgi:hypothetical protein